MLYKNRKKKKIASNGTTFLLIMFPCWKGNLLTDLPIFPKNGMQTM